MVGLSVAPGSGGGIPLGSARCRGFAYGEAAANKRNAPSFNSASDTLRLSIPCSSGISTPQVGREWLRVCRKAKHDHP